MQLAVTLKRPKVLLNGWRSRQVADRISIVVLCLTSILHFLPAIWEGNNFGPFDILSQWPLTQAGGNITPHNTLSADQIAQNAPWNLLDWQMIHHGELPLWNRYDLLGLPQFFNFQTAPFSLPNLVSYLFPADWAYLVIVVVTLIIAGTGAYVFARCLGLSPLAALFAGVTFQLSGAIANWVGWTLADVNAWTGWILAFSYLLLTTREHRRRHVTLLALSVMFALYAGHPESYALLAFSCALFLVLLSVIGLMQRRWTWQQVAIFLGWEVLAILLGACLAAPLMLPGAQMVTLAARLHVTIYSGGLPIKSLIGLIAQGYYGYPISSSTALFPDYYEISAYVGPLAVIFGIYAFIKQRLQAEIIALLVMALVLTVAVFHLTLYGILVDHIDVLKSIAITRGLMPLDFCIAILGGYGFELIARSAPAARFDRWLLVVTGAIMAIVGLMLLNTITDHTLSKPAQVIRLQSFLWPLVLILIFAITVLLRRQTGLWAYVARYGVLAGQITFLVTAGMFVNSYSKTAFPQTAAVSTLQATVQDGLVGRYITYNDTLGFFPDSNMAYHTRQFAVYEPIFPSMYQDSWQEVTGSLPNFGIAYFTPDINSAAIAKIYGVNVIVAPPIGVFQVVPDAQAQLATALKGTTVDSPTLRTALAQLLTTYANREDVQIAFPWKEPDALTELLNWAILYNQDFQSARPQLQAFMDYQQQHTATQQAVFDLLQPGVPPGMVQGPKTSAYQLFVVPDAAQFTLGEEDPQAITSVKWLNNYTCQITVHAASATSVIARVTNLPGWHADVNGQPAAIRPWHVAMQEIPVPAGTSTITLTYWPPLFSLGLWLALGAVLVLALWWLVPMGIRALRQRQPSQEPTATAVGA